MKKLMCIASLALPAVCAHAQSSVTLYGIIISGVSYVHNSDGQSSQFRTTSFGSRWGMRGSEDLGGGLKTVFILENGYNSNNGGLAQGGREFGRKAVVGLSSDTLGTVTLGRQFDPMVDLVQPLQANTVIGVFTAPGDVDNADASIRIQNSVKWVSPTWGGVKAEALYGVGGVAGSATNGQSYAAGLGYNKGSLGLGAGYLHIDNGTASLRGTATTTSTADSLFGSAVNSAYSSAKAIEIVRAIATYQFGPVTVGTLGSFSDYEPDGASKFKTSEKYKVISPFAIWQITAPLSTNIGYLYMKSSGASSATYHEAAFQVDYALSKSTDVYSFIAYTHASGSNGLGAAQAVIGSLDQNAGKPSQVNINFSIRHFF